MYGHNDADPLGVAVKGRAREKRLAASLQGLLPVGGPLPDPNWEGYFQSVDEAAKGKPVKFAYEGQQADDLSRDPEAVASQLQGMPFAETFNDPSTQLGTRREKEAPYSASTRPSLAALRKQLGVR